MFNLSKHGGDRVRKGNYWNLSSGERIPINNEGRLPGDRETTYLKFHPLALVVIGPLMGLVYAVFLPFVAIAMVSWLLFRKVFGGVAEALQRAAVFGWQPSEAYLAGRKRPGEQPPMEKAGEDDEADAPPKE